MFDNQRRQFNECICMRDILAAGVPAFRTRSGTLKWRNIFGARNKIHIINLEHTLPAFIDGQKFAIWPAKATKFVCWHRCGSESLRNRRPDGQPFVDQRWLGGMLTNYKTIRQSIRRLQDSNSKLLMAPSRC